MTERKVSFDPCGTLTEICSKIIPLTPEEKKAIENLGHEGGDFIYEDTEESQETELKAVGA